MMDVREREFDYGFVFMRQAQAPKAEHMTAEEGLRRTMFVMMIAQLRRLTCNLKSKVNI